MATVTLDSDPFIGSPKDLLREPSKAVIEDSTSDDESDNQPYYVPKSKPNGKSPWSRRTVISDSEEEVSDVERGAADGSNERDTDKGNESDNNDGAILIFDDPPSRKPLPRPASPIKPTLNRALPAPAIHATPSGGQVLIANPSPLPTPVFPRVPPGKQSQLPNYFMLATSPTKGKSPKKDRTNDSAGVGPSIATKTIPTSDAAPSMATSAMPMTPAGAKTPAKRGVRMSKKALEEQKLAHLAAYAQELFNDLNQSVFKNLLPKETALVWNKKLQTTAGRAKWHISREKVETTSIELATKVLDCEERIRNTLSHEMCHLASWVINRKPKENHGVVFHGWANKVMERNGDIVITTKHSYDITYKFEWQCQNAVCKKIYGRHSKSIKPESSVCGVCRTGDLLPLFQTRQRKTKANSNMSADKTRDSPSTLNKTGSHYLGEVGPPYHLQQHNGASSVTSVSVTDLALSGVDTDTDDCVLTDPPGSSQMTIKASDPKSHTKRGASGSGPKYESHSAGRDIGDLVTHMSIIDLTED
ncbi:SprT-like family-domain-containing protein [Phellopilus nigrolimitatus]|nr:SprT-like family-domain-containing protein [Phellopilus nigrolimitatus]